MDDKRFSRKKQAPQKNPDPFSLPFSLGFPLPVNPWLRRTLESYLTDEELRLLNAHLQSGAVPA